MNTLYILKDQRDWTYYGSATTLDGLQLFLHDIRTHNPATFAELIIEVNERNQHPTYMQAADWK